MRKILLAIVFVSLISNLVSAQSTRIGFYVGPVAANMFQKVGDVKHNTDYAMGATIGILLDVPMQKYGSFQPGLNYVGKNSKDEFLVGTETNKTKTTLSYLELPLNALFRVPAGPGKFTVGGGVAVAMALDGKRETIDGNNNKEEKDLNFGDNANDDFAQYDFGINGLAGYEFKNGFFVTFNYNCGIHRLYVGGDPKDKLFNRYIAMRVGFLLGGKK